MMHWFLACLAAVAICGVTGRPKKYVDKVLLVSMDGFRWDYLDMYNTPHFDYFVDQGVRVKYVNNTFITQTFPCHYTIATGLYEESHGIVSNDMYDPDFDETFTMRTHESKWWEGGEPIWITATKQNLKSGTFFWPGSEVEIKGVRPSIWKPYKQSVPFEERIDTVMDWFVNQGVHLATLYFHEPDHTGHVYGPNGPEMKQMVEHMDSILGLLMKKLRENGLWDTINVIVTSDHGMTSVDVDHQMVDINDFLPKGVVKRVPNEGPVINILPEEGQLDLVYESLKNQSKEMHMTVYKKEDIPDHFHYKNNRRIMPIIGLADEGWLLINNKHHYDYHPDGTHGYNNDFMTMKPIFVAHGPNFKTNYGMTSINSVDIYPLVCELLGITPAPNNGTLTNTDQMLKRSDSLIG